MFSVNFLVRSEGRKAEVRHDGEMDGGEEKEQKWGEGIELKNKMR